MLAQPCFWFLQTAVLYKGIFLWRTSRNRKSVPRTLSKMARELAVLLVLTVAIGLTKTDSPKQGRICDKQSLVLFRNYAHFSFCCKVRSIVCFQKDCDTWLFSFVFINTGSFWNSYNSPNACKFFPPNFKSCFAYI